MHTDPTSNQPAINTAPAQMPFDDLLKSQAPADNRLSAGGGPDPIESGGSGGNLSLDTFLHYGGRVVLTTSGQAHNSSFFVPLRKEKYENAEAGIEWLKDQGPKVFARIPIGGVDFAASLTREGWAGNYLRWSQDILNGSTHARNTQLSQLDNRNTAFHHVGLDAFTRLPIPGTGDNTATFAIGARLTVKMKSWSHTISDDPVDEKIAERVGETSVSSRPRFYLNTSPIGYYMKAVVPLDATGNPPPVTSTRFTPMIRIEVTGGANLGKSNAAAGAGGVIEIDLMPNDLVSMLPAPAPGGGSGHQGPRICYRVPGSDHLLDITGIAEPLLDEAYKAEIQPLHNTGTDAQYFDASGQPKVWSVDMEDVGDKLMAALAPYVPEGLEEQATAALAYAPLVGTTAQYAPTAYRTARVAQMINTAVRSGTARSLIADSGPAIVYSAGIAMTIQTLTNPAFVSYAMTGEQNPALSITASLDDTLTEVSPWAFDKWVEDKDATYPDLLQILQSEIAAPERTGQARNEATGYIQNTPALRYLDGLEGYAKTHGLDGLVIGSAAAIAEDLVQNASAAERPQIIADLENQFGLIRDQDDLNQQGGWWVTASDVDQGDGKPMADQGKLWDKLAALWRSEFKQKQIDRERAVEVISTFAQNLGLHITPEIAGKIADKARA